MKSFDNISENFEEVVAKCWDFLYYFWENWFNLLCQKNQITLREYENFHDSYIINKDWLKVTFVI